MSLKNVRKCKQTYSNRKKNIISCQGSKGQKYVKGRYKENFGTNRYICCLDCGDNLIDMPGLMKLYTLNICSLLYVNYTSIKLLKTKIVHLKVPGLQ